jgi:hypothetical protein
MSMADNRWSIVAVADDGETASIEVNKHSHLRQLLVKAVNELYGPGHNVDEYELVVGGVKQVNLDLTLEQAGLRDEAEVVVQPQDVSKG